MWNLAPLLLMGLGAASSALGARSSARSQQLNYQFQADIGEINAQIAERGAKAAALRGTRAQQQSRMRTSQMRSRQRAALAANGIALDSPTAVSLLTTTDYLGEVDADTIAANALQEAWGYRTQAMNARAGAGAAAATAASINPNQAFRSSLLGSAGQLASGWYYLNPQSPGAVSAPWAGSGYGPGPA